MIAYNDSINVGTNMIYDCLDRQYFVMPLPALQPIRVLPCRNPRRNADESDPPSSEFRDMTRLRQPFPRTMANIGGQPHAGG
nr:hypothetical protein [Paenibacillus etheri]